jgi:hypothetical protein
MTPGGIGTRGLRHTTTFRGAGFCTARSDGVSTRRMQSMGLPSFMATTASGIASASSTIPTDTDSSHKAAFAARWSAAEVLRSPGQEG